MQLMGRDKPIWRLAFFSRLEERKGIKLFVDAINQLDVSHIPNFEVRPLAAHAPSALWHSAAMEPLTLAFSIEKSVLMSLSKCNCSATH